LSVVSERFDLGEVGALISLSGAADILGLDDANDDIALVGAVAFHALDLLGDRDAIRRLFEGLPSEQHRPFDRDVVIAPSCVVGTAVLVCRRPMQAS
jgi:hypothetical protein